jgi:hypothetical protein
MVTEHVLRRPEAVVVSGAHRSGTSVLGEVVAQVRNTWLVWEPFNQHWGLRGVAGAYPFQVEAEAPLVAALRHYLCTGWAAWSVKRGSSGRASLWARTAAQRWRRWWLWRRNRGATAVIKDPFALLSLPALQQSITAAPALVAVRHPCSWILSLRRVGWPAGPELNALIAQDAVYEAHLAELLPRRDWRKVDDLETGARAWTCLYHLFLVQMDFISGTGALVMPMETFSREPVASMQVIFGALGLPSPRDLAYLATEYTGPNNVVAPVGKAVHLLRRDSRRLSDAWKEQMCRADIERVRRITESVFDRLYQSWDDAAAEPQLLP